MLVLTPQNFLSAATGIALAVALIRGFSRSSMRTVGNFWVDVTRTTLYVLLPICVVATLFLVWQGVPQTLGPYVGVATLRGQPNSGTRANRLADGSQAAELHQRRFFHRQPDASDQEPHPHSHPCRTYT